MDIDPDIKKALDERIDWINAVTERAVADNWQGVQEAINQLEDEQLRGMIYVLILTRGGDAKLIREYLAKTQNAPRN